MAEYRLGRSEYYFDPTAIEAVAGASRAIRPTRRENAHHASTIDIAPYLETVFEPDRLITLKQVARGRKRLKFRQLERLKEALRWAEDRTKGGE